MHTPPLGLIEGYFGKPWPHERRKAVIACLADYGFGFFHYAPKADGFLRRRWREPHPPDQWAALVDLAQHCRAHGVRCGVGLSPYEVYLDFTGAAKLAFIDKVRSLLDLGFDELAILFDDMRGDIPDLAARQAEVVHCALAQCNGQRLVTCPTYYSNDPVLDAVFGQRPQDYLSAFGRALDGRVGVYWTGEEVCSKEYSPGHLAGVADLLGRRPILWDNYPVNDGPRMSDYLHLRGFTGRPHSIGPFLEGHAINPALQPTLSLIPALTLAASYRSGEAYCYMESFREAARIILGPDLATLIQADLMSFEDRGLARLGDRKETLRARYSGFGTPGAQEIVDWLDGLYAVSRWEIETS